MAEDSQPASRLTMTEKSDPTLKGTFHEDPELSCL